MTASGGPGGGSPPARCEVAQATPADGWTVDAEEDRQYTVWPHPDVRLPFRQGIQAEAYRVAYLPDVPLAFLSGMSIGREQPGGHVEEWLVAMRILREYAVRVHTRPYTAAGRQCEENTALDDLLK